MDEAGSDLDPAIDRSESNSSEERKLRSSTFKTRIGVFAYAPVDNAVNAMPLNGSFPVTPSPRKRRAGSTSTSTSTNSKRHATSNFESESPSAFTLLRTKARKPSGAARKALRSTDLFSPVNNLVDSIRPGLMLLMIGLNPGLKTAETGHAYAHPSNLFWKLLHTSGLTSRRHAPSETRDLMDLYSIGNTNLCVRATRDGAGLKSDELEAGVPILDEKVRAFRPEVVCIVGKGIWDTIFKVKSGGKKQKKEEFAYGWQDEKLWLGREVSDDGQVMWKGARTFVATTTSGLAAGMRLPEKEAIWKQLGDWIVARREEVSAEAETNEDVKVECQ